MKVELPEELKANVPPTLFGRILATTPVVMAVVATMLAGLSSSEMTRAQYDRSMAAQQQSKAGDQWSFFQAKRLRGAYQQNTAELLQNLSDVRAFDAAGMRAWAEGKGDLAKLLDSDWKRALECLERGSPPLMLEFYTGKNTNRNVSEALRSMNSPYAEVVMPELLAKLTDAEITAALVVAMGEAEAYDAATKPINGVVDQLDARLPKLGVPASGAGFTLREFTVARLHYTAARYETEARLNQSIATIYELQVRKSNYTSERHHKRSQEFFYGMLAAQLGVIVSTFAVAAKKRNLLWTVAAGAGLIAVAFATYVYLWV